MMTRSSLTICSRAVTSPATRAAKKRRSMVVGSLMDPMTATATASLSDIHVPVPSSASSSGQRRGENLAVAREGHLAADGEIDGPSVAGPLRRRAASFGGGDQVDAASVGVHHPDLVVLVAAVRGEGDLPAVGGPRRPAVER